VQLQFDAAVTRFGDLSPEDHLPERIGDYSAETYLMLAAIACIGRATDRKQCGFDVPACSQGLIAARQSGSTCPAEATFGRHVPHWYVCRSGPDSWYPVTLPERPFIPSKIAIGERGACMRTTSVLLPLSAGIDSCHACCAGTASPKKVPYAGSRADGVPPRGIHWSNPCGAAMRQKLAASGLGGEIRNIQFVHPLGRRRPGKDAGLRQRTGRMSPSVIVTSTESRPRRQCGSKPRRFQSCLHRLAIRLAADWSRA
jgi:hypothetical protein